MKRAVAVYVLLVCTVFLGESHATELLQFPGFEAGCGGAPPPFPWMRQWNPLDAGALTTTSAARTDDCGLWTYTAETSDHSFCYIYQSLGAVQGQIFKGQAYARGVPESSGGSWVSGSFACVRVSFLDPGGATIASYESSRVTEADDSWDSLAVVTDSAPPGTDSVQFALHIEKKAGISGQSVANFDDCSLIEVNVPAIRVSVGALGFGLDIDTQTFTIENAGSGTLTWSITKDAEWIVLSNETGETTTEVDSVTVTINRAVLSPDERMFHGSMYIDSNGDSTVVVVYVEEIDPLPTVPQQPARVWTEGYRIKLQDRMPDGSLGIPRPYHIRGACWSPASVGTPNDRYARQAEYATWYRLDLQMMSEMNANTAYVLIDFDTTATSFDILDYCYYNEIMVIVTVDWDGTYDLDRLDAVVQSYKNHPAILMWAIGNEWNINYYHGAFESIWDAAAATDAAAKRIKGMDADHPVAAIYGEIEILPHQPLAYTDSIVNTICSDVDAWGLNIYRGATFGTLFTQWKSISTKPMFISEFGTDAFRTLRPDSPTIQGYVDEAMQGEFIAGLWGEIHDNLSCYNLIYVCAGGTVFEWCDEWWKTGLPGVHEPHGYYTYWNLFAFPDAFGNEEYFGIVNIDRSVKESYIQFKYDYSIPPSEVEKNDEAPSVLEMESFTLNWITGRETSIGEVSLWIPVRSNVAVSVYNVQGRLVRSLFSGALPGGRHALAWDGCNSRGSTVASGVYFCRASVNGKAKAVKIIIVK